MCECFDVYLDKAQMTNVVMSYHINQKFTKFTVFITLSLLLSYNSAILILHYQLVGCDKLVLLYCIYIWFGFTLILARINSKLLNHPSKLS